MSEFGFDPYIIAQYQQLGNQSSNSDMQTLADVALKRTQNQAAKFQLGRQQNLADLVSQNAGAFTSPYAQALAKGGYGQEAYEAQNNALMLGQKILGIHRDITASRLSAAQTPEQLDAVLSTLPSDVQQYYGAPAKEATSDEKENWRKSFIAGQLSPEEQAKNRELKETGVPGEMVVFDKSSGKVSPAGTSSAGAALTGPALDSAAKQFAQTGHVPDVGGDVSGRNHRAILARAEELFPGQNIAAKAAAYEADKSSLEHLQQQADLTKGTIRTFDKNLKVLEDLLPKLDSSNSLGWNKVKREWQTKVSGDPNLTAFKQALSTVTSEAGKINSGSTGQGGVPLSVLDEMERNLPENATPAQVKAAIGVLIQDSKNRIAAQTEQLAEVKGRLGGKTSASGESKAAPKAAPKEAVSHPKAPDALTWARQHKGDPRAAEILKRLGVK